MGWPWKWWEVSFSSAELETIEKVKQEFEEEPPNTTTCKGTQRFPGMKSYSGTPEHAIIQFDYMNQHPLTAEREYTIPQSSESGKNGYADIVNKLTGEIFEIKPATNQTEIAKGRTEVARYVEKANVFCGGGFSKGNAYPERILPYPGRPDKNMKVILIENGIIGYLEVPKQTQPIIVPIPQSVSDKLKQFIKSLVEYPEMAEEKIAFFLEKNPEIKNYLITAGVTIIIGTILEDFASLGAGFINDLTTIMLGLKLIRLARAL